MHYATNAYRRIARETATPRELEAILLLDAAAKLQEADDSWGTKPTVLNDAMMFNRQLWLIFIDAVMQDNNKLPMNVRANLANLGVFVLGETFALMTKPKRDSLKAIIRINRSIATALRSQRAA
jgi:flagellar biosynthesis activator protein FlaF